MTYVALQGPNLFWPPVPTHGNQFVNNMLIDATGEKAAFVGQVWFPERTGSKTISRVQFRFSTVTKSGGSGLTVSLQNVSSTAGAPYQPDETQDQIWAISNGDANFVSNAWYRTSALGTGRSVSIGENLAVVFEYDSSGRLGSDSVTIATANNGNSTSGDAGASLKTGGSWAAVGVIPVLVLEFDDGTFGTLSNAIAATTISSWATLSTSNPDEVGFEFVAPFNCKVDGIWHMASRVANTADGSLCLVDGTGVDIVTASFDANQVRQNNNPILGVLSIPETELVAGITYRLTCRPSNTNVALVYIETDNADHMQLNYLPSGAGWVQRTDLGSFSVITTTRKPMLGFRVSAIDDGTGPATPSTTARTVSLDLVDRTGVTQASLTGLKWSWFDSTDVSDLGSPIDSGSTETTDAGGTLDITVNTTLASGAEGHLALSSSDGVSLGLYKLTVT